MSGELSEKLGDRRGRNVNDNTGRTEHPISAMYPSMFGERTVIYLRLVLSRPK